MLLPVFSELQCLVGHVTRHVQRVALRGSLSLFAKDIKQD